MVDKKFTDTKKRLSYDFTYAAIGCRIYQFIIYRLSNFSSAIEVRRFWNVYMHALHIRNKSRHREQMYARCTFAVSSFHFSI